MHKEVSERLREVIKKSGMTYKEFAKKHGIPYRTLQNYLLGLREPSALVLQKCAIEGFNVHWILTGEGEMFLKKGTVPVSPAKPAPVIKQNVPIDFLNTPLSEEHVDGYIYVPDLPEEAMAIRVRDDSMSPALEYGDYALFLPEGKTEIRSGDVVVVKNEWNELMLRRYREKEGEIFLTSDNPRYPTVKMDEKYRVVGKVIKKIRIQDL